MLAFQQASGQLVFSFTEMVSKEEDVEEIDIGFLRGVFTGCFLHVLVVKRNIESKRIFCLCKTSILAKGERQTSRNHKWELKSSKYTERYRSINLFNQAKKKRHRFQS
jgi:hypothetical protein